MEGYFRGWSKMQQESMEIARESFPGRQLFTMELQDHEIGGVEMLGQMADLVYGDTDILQVFSKEKTFWIEKKDGNTVFAVALPFAHEEEVEAGMLEGDIIVSFRNERRRFKLPDQLRGMDILSYTWRDGVLSVVLKAA
jgi:arsenite-transporting ATPase